MHSAEHIADEIEQLVRDYKIEAFFIYDDLFTLNKKRLRELIKILKERDLLLKNEMKALHLEVGAMTRKKKDVK